MISAREVPAAETCPGRHWILRFKEDRLPVIVQPSLPSSPPTLRTDILLKENIEMVYILPYPTKQSLKQYFERVSVLEYYTYSNVVTVQRYYRTSKNRAFSVPPLYKSALTQSRVLCPQARGRASLHRTEHYNRMCRNRGYFPVIFPVRDLTCPDIFIFAQTGADLDR